MENNYRFELKQEENEWCGVAYLVSTGEQVGFTRCHATLELALTEIKKIAEFDATFRVPNCMKCSTAISPANGGWCDKCKGILEEEHEEEMFDRACIAAETPDPFTYRRNY